MKLQKSFQGKVIFWLIITVSCSGCASVYVPSARNVPLFTKRGQFQIQTSFGNGTNANAAYALTNHIAVSAGAMYANNKLLLKNDWRIHQSAEVALGIYGTKKKTTFELFGGYGIGDGHGEEVIFGWFFFSNSREIAKASYKKYFIQPSVGFTHKRLQFVGTVRISRIDFNAIEVGAVGGQFYDVREKSFISFEPSFTLKLYPIRVYQPFHVFWQVGFNVIDDPKDNIEFRYSLLHYGIGIGLKFKRQ